MIKKLGILLLALIAAVGLSSAVSAQPIATSVGSTYGGHYTGQGGHNPLIKYRHRYFPPFYRFHHRYRYFPPYYRFHHRHHYFPPYYRFHHRYHFQPFYRR